MFRVRGKGVKPVRGGRVGDLICRVVVETPVNLTERQKELLREFDASVQEGGSRHSPSLAPGWTGSRASSRRWASETAPPYFLGHSIGMLSRFSSIQLEQESVGDGVGRGSKDME